jgi:hypothetical protein
VTTVTYSAQHNSQFIGQGTACSGTVSRVYFNVGVPCHAGIISVVMFEEQYCLRGLAVHFAKHYHNFHILQHTFTGNRFWKLLTAVPHGFS